MLSGALTVAGWASAQGGSPDLAPPPGALNPQVTQATIQQTICARGWTRTIRPPYAYTWELKRKQMHARHLDGPPSAYEEDHLIPLELGGAPYDPANLWPQSWPDTQKKDTLEWQLNRAVCAGRMTLQDAQQCIRRDWIACGRQMGIPTP